MTDEIDLILLDRYRAGECSPAERARVERWMATDPARAEVAAWMRSLEAAAATLPDPWEPSALWAGMRRELAKVEGAPEVPQPSQAPTAVAASDAASRRSTVELAIARRPPRVRRLLRAAAAVAVIGSGAILWRLGDRVTERAAEKGAFRTFAAAAGERVTVRLVDGSFVMIDAGSSIRVPGAFGRVDRNVYLDGRAYFEVATDSARPFRVFGGRGVARVLGTKFGVRAYRDDSTVSVVVREGRVALSAVPDSTAGSAVPVSGSVILGRGDRGTLTPTSELGVERGVPVDYYLAWTTGRLAFRNTKLRDVLPELSRHYGIEFVAGDPRVDALLWTASLEHETEPEVVRLLAESLELDVERHDDRVILRLPPSKGLSR